MAERIEARATFVVLDCGSLAAADDIAMPSIPCCTWFRPRATLKTFCAYCLRVDWEAMECECCLMPCQYPLTSQTITPAEHSAVRVTLAKELRSSNSSGFSCQTTLPEGINSVTTLLPVLVSITT